jgi:CPA2 family monovalent cation:H+ antiporter-2
MDRDGRLDNAGMAPNRGAGSRMTLWMALLDLLILLAGATALGAACERIGLTPLFGYLLAGTLLGPNALDLLPSHEAVASIAELGVALLLFTIGIEFSWRRLRAIGPVALGGGTLQVLVTGGLAAAVCLAIGLDASRAVVFGAAIALSSTAAVLRLLESRAEIDAVHGRYAVGILLLQDIAVVPLVLVVAFLGEGGSAEQVGWGVARTIGFGLLLVGALYVLLTFVLPRLMGARVAQRSPDLPVLLAVVAAIGAIWLAHELGLSPALGAFLAGMLLAESPFATRIQADIIPFRTLFVTLFFCSIGMLADPVWVARNWVLLAGVTLAVVVGKTVVTAGVVRLFGIPLGLAVAAGLVLAQVGEFSLLIAALARQLFLIGPDEFDLIVATMMTTLFLSPALTAVAPRAAVRVAGRARTGETAAPDPEQATDELETRASKLRNHIILVGFGPAGRRAAELAMADRVHPTVVVDLNPRGADMARSYGLLSLIGDAGRSEVLEHLHVASAACVVITVPDPWTARRIVLQVRSTAPHVPIVARSRYHVHKWQLMMAGADAVVDEEEEVGVRIADEVRLRLSESDT